MARYSYGPQVQARVKRLFAALLAHAEDTAYQGDSNLSIRRLEDRPNCFIVKTKRRFLEQLPKHYDGQTKLKPAEVREALSHHLAEYLGILVDNRTETQGSEEWHFTITLWATDIQANLQCFDNEWNAKRSDKSKQYIADVTAIADDTNTRSSARVFIVYKRNVEPDASLAMQMYEALGQKHSVFIDRNLQIGVAWAEKLDTEIRQSDFVIALLSEQSVGSEMLQREIRIAHQTAQNLSERPKLLPVRVAYQQPFPYPISTYLNPIQWASWQGAKDTPRLLEEIEAAISGGLLPMKTQPSDSTLTDVQPFPIPIPAAQPWLDLPDGTMESSSPFYVERDSDLMALETIQQQGKTISIKGPRQVGKSSLLNRVAQTAISLGKQVVFLDFQEFDRATLQDADAFYRHFCLNITYELDLEDETEKYWKIPLANKQRCTRYIGNYLLQRLGQPLVLAMDEVERIFDTPFRDDFFSMLRSWHNQRARSPIWKQLDIVVVTSTEPYELIADLNQSPFNVGTILSLKDFTPAQVRQLNQQYGLPFTPVEEESLIDLVYGHPFLVQRALYWVASKKMTSTELFSQAVSENEPFGSHLKHHLFRIHNNPEQVAGLLEVFDKHECTDRGVYHLLQGAGLVREERPSVIVPRCQLYKAYLESRLKN